MIRHAAGLLVGVNLGLCQRLGVREIIGEVIGVGDVGQDLGIGRFAGLQDLGVFGRLVIMLGGHAQLQRHIGVIDLVLIALRGGVRDGLRGLGGAFHVLVVDVDRDGHAGDLVIVISGAAAIGHRGIDGGLCADPVTLLGGSLGIRQMTLHGVRETRGIGGNGDKGGSGQKDRRQQGAGSIGRHCTNSFC